MWGYLGGARSTHLGPVLGLIRLGLLAPSGFIPVPRIQLIVTLHVGTELSRGGGGNFEL